MTDASLTFSGRNKLNIALWVAQILLAAAYLIAGYTKVSQPLDQLVLQMGWINDFPSWLPRFIGTAEILGAFGLILPSVTRVLPWLTPLAAAGLSLVQILAIPLHLSRGEAFVLPVNLVLLALALFVLWGRWKKAPISPR